MKIYPAVDLMDGKAVRLFKGKKGSRKVYGDPVEMARRFSGMVDKIHIVDLDGAFQGRPQNLDAVKTIIAETGLRVQVGGGFREYHDIEKAYSVGVDNVIMGTRALDEDFLKLITHDFPGITVSLDCRDGMISLAGWEQESGVPLEEAFGFVRKYVDRMIYTDINRDGTLEGISMEHKFWDNEEMIYAGGVTTLEDVRRLKKLEFSCAIIGKAIYEGKISLKDALKEV